MWKRKEVCEFKLITFECFLFQEIDAFEKWQHLLFPAILLLQGFVKFACYNVHLILLFYCFHGSI